MNNMYLRSLIICLIFSMTLAKFPYGKKLPKQLVGGRDPKAGEIKYIVAIHSYIYMCGGGIIGKKFVLTAAHCINVNKTTGKVLQPLKIIAGTNVVYGYNKANAIEIEVSRAILPSVYFEGSNDDIAVLELKKVFNFIKYHAKIKKLELPKPLPNDLSRYSDYANEFVKFAAYGDVHARIVYENGKYKLKSSGAGSLKVANALIDSPTICAMFYKEPESKTMCLDIVEDRSRNNPQGVCLGDSGSPAVYNNNVLIGLASRERYCNSNRSPSLFTRVSYFLPFINKAINNDTRDLVVYET